MPLDSGLDTATGAEREGKERIGGEEKKRYLRKVK